MRVLPCLVSVEKHPGGGDDDSTVVGMAGGRSHCALSVNLWDIVARSVGRRTWRGTGRMSSSLRTSESLSYSGWSVHW